MFVYCLCYVIGLSLNNFTVCVLFYLGCLFNVCVLFYSGLRVILFGLVLCLLFVYCLCYVCLLFVLCLFIVCVMLLG